MKSSSLPTSSGAVVSCEHLSFLFSDNQKGVLCPTLPSPALYLYRENEFEEAGWVGAWKKRSVAQEALVFLFM